MKRVGLPHQNLQYILFSIRDELVVSPLEDLGFAGLRIVLGVDEALPLLVVDGREVSTVVETRITGFFAEGDVLHVQTDGPQTMVVLPAAEQLVEVTGGELLGVFFQHAEQPEASVEELLGGGVAAYSSVHLMRRIMKLRGEMKFGFTTESVDLSLYCSKV